MLEEPEVDRDHVAHGDEVAALLARAVAAVFAEQLDPAARLPFVELVERDRCHPALVLLARPVDVEVAKAGDLRLRRRQGAPHHLVEQQLRPAVDVERPLEIGLLAKRGRAAVGGRRGGVEQAHALRLAGIEQGLRAR
jgi:hypothetical protein